MANMTTATVTAAIMTKYKKRAQSFLRKRLYLNRLGTEEEINRYEGQTLSTFRVDNQTAQTSALTEGTAPAEIQITTTTFTTTLQQFGAFVKISDLLEVTGRSSMMDQVSKQLGYNAALTLDTIMRNEFYSNATDHFANNKADGTIGAADVFNAKELRRLGRKFKAKDVNPGDDGCFNIVLHPDQEYDLQIDTDAGGWMDILKRKDMSDKDGGVWNGESGKLAGFRIIYSSQITKVAAASGQDVFRAIASGPDAIMNVRLSAMPFMLFVNPSSNITISNPLGQLGSVGWKATYAAKYIGDDGPRSYIVKSAVSEETA